MQHRSLGGITTSVLGLGTSRMASMGANRSRRDAERLLGLAADLGVTLIDTSDTYGSTAAERWLGDLTSRMQDKFVIVTKAGLTAVDLPGPLRVLNQPGKKVLQKLGRTQMMGPAHVRHSIDGSLRRLRRERVEFYLLHSPSTGVENRDDLFAVLEAARLAGKIGTYGVSTQAVDVIDAVRRVRGCQVAETMVNPARTELFSSRPSDVTDVDLIANQYMIPSHDRDRGGGGPVYDRLQRASRESGRTHAQLLLRHAAAVPGVKVVLTGTANPKHLAENVSALEEPISSSDLLL